MMGSPGENKSNKKAAEKDNVGSEVICCLEELSRQPAR